MQNNAILQGTLTVTNGAGVSTTIGNTIENLSQCSNVVLLATLASVAGGSLDVYVQVRYGATWTDYAHFPTIPAAGAGAIYRLCCSRYAAPDAPIRVGTGATPALAANTCAQGDFGDAMRIVVVANAGAAAAGVQSIDVCMTFPAGEPS